MDNVSEPSVLDAQSSPALRRSRAGFRFSLLSLCGIVALACVVAGLWGVARRERAAVQRATELAQVVETQAAENQRLRSELGYLFPKGNGHCSTPSVRFRRGAMTSRIN